jgi:PAS domain S-box-containing protein/diguanylate cyclase (GGDEF)-like protein
MDAERWRGTHLDALAPVTGDPPPSHDLGAIAGRAVRVYALAGTVWILATDLAFGAARDDPASAVPEMAKGLLFVAVTATVLWVFLRHATDRVDRLHLRTATRARDFYSSVLATSADLIVIADADGRLIFVSDAATELLGWQPSEMLGRRGREFLHPTDATTAIGYREGVLRAPEVGGAERSFVVRHRDGSYRAMAVRGAPIPLGDGSTGVVMNVRDVTDRTRAERQVQAALAEDVTGLPNLQMFMAEMDLIDQLRPEGLAAVAVLVDVDRFGDVNDLHGRPGGDAVLRELARRLESVLPDAVGVWRHGADEFITVLLDDGAGTVVPEALTERIQAAVFVPIPVDEVGTEVAVALSVGVAVVDLCTRAGGGPLGADLLREAETALAEAKRHPDRTSVRLPGVARSSDRARLVAELHDAVERGQLVVRYQPKIRLDDLGVGGVEALVRWDHPTRGLLGPDEFLPVVAEANLSTAVLRVVLDHALAHVARWVAVPGCDPEFGVSVNVSADDLRRRRFVDDVFDALRRSEVEPSRLCLELTEQTLLADAVGARRTVDELRRAGVQVSIDDFGTGYSTLEHIRMFEVDELKIDKRFVERLGSSPADEIIVDSVLAIGARVGVRLVAEGIEHAAAHEYLRGRGCPLGQGYLFSRPVRAEEIDPAARYVPQS